MKNLEKIFMLIGIISAIASMISCIYLGTSWTWQFATIMWILVAYMKEKLIERYRRLVDQITNK